MFKSMFTPMHVYIHVKHIQKAKKHCKRREGTVFICHHKHDTVHNLSYLLSVIISDSGYITMALLTVRK